MKRREFMALAAGTAAWPMVARAQTSLRRIGFLASGAATSINSSYLVKTIKRGLDGNGLVEGRDYSFEPRFAAGRYGRISEIARDLAEARANVILVDSIAAVRAAQSLVPRMPVVMISIDDPVGTGLIASLARPGGYTTGTATLNGDLALRMLELQRAILPNASSIAILYNPANPTNAALLQNIRQRAGALGLSVLPVEFQSRDELEAAFKGFARRPDALQVITDSGTGDLSDRIAALAIARRLPAFSNTPEFAKFGGLLAYGPSREQLYLRSGYFVKKILDGADPGDLPVEQASRIELWVNPTTAKTLGITVPASLLAIADKIVE